MLLIVVVCARASVSCSFFILQNRNLLSNAQNSSLAGVCVCVCVSVCVSVQYDYFREVM